MSGFTVQCKSDDPHGSCTVSCAEMRAGRECCAPIEGEPRPALDGHGAPTWSFADLDLIADALYDAVSDYAERAAEELDEHGQEAADEWTRKSERADALFERVCRELDRLKPSTSPEAAL